MGKQKNRVTKWSPVSPMDFPRFESWLEEMAGKGLLVHRVQQNLFSLARVKFRRDEPHPHRRYRVCPAQGQQQAREEPSQEPGAETGENGTGEETQNGEGQGE